jgi:hypothetical protein
LLTSSWGVGFITTLSPKGSILAIFPPFLDLL